MDKSKSLSRLLNTVIKKKYSDISNIKVTYRLRSFISLRDGEGNYHHYDIEVICNNNDYEWDASDVMDDIKELSKMILVNSNERIYSIFFREKKKQIDEISYLNESVNRRMVDILEDLLNQEITKHHNFVCKVKVKHPEDREVLDGQPKYTQWSITLHVLGGYGTDYFPTTQRIRDMYDNAMDEAWNVAYSFMNIPTDVYYKLVKTCEEI